MAYSKRQLARAFKVGGTRRPAKKQRIAQSFSAAKRGSGSNKPRRVPSKSEGNGMSYNKSDCGRKKQ